MYKQPPRAIPLNVGSSSYAHDASHSLTRKRRFLPRRHALCRSLGQWPTLLCQELARRNQRLPALSRPHCGHVLADAEIHAHQPCSTDYALHGLETDLVPSVVWAVESRLDFSVSATQVMSKTEKRRRLLPDQNFFEPLWPWTSELSWPVVRARLLACPRFG